MSRPKTGKMQSLAVRVLVWMLGVAFVPLVIMAVQGLHCANQAVVDLESTHLRIVLNNKQARIEDWLTERVNDLHTLAMLPRSWPEGVTSLSRMAEENVAGYGSILARMQTQNASYQSITVLSPDWKPIVWTGEQLHMGADGVVAPAFRSRLATADDVVVLPPHTHADGILGVHAGVPIRGTNGVPAGYVVAAINLSDAVYPLLARGDASTGGPRVHLLTEQGRSIGGPSGDRYLLSGDGTVPAELLTGTRETVVEYRNARGVPVLGVSVDMPRLGWVLVAEIEKAEAFRWVHILMRRAAWTAFVTLAVVAFLAWRASHRLLSPLRALSATARRIAAGHWNERVAPLSGTEPRDVAQAFNRMLDELDAMRRRLVRSAALSAIGELSSSIVHEMRNPLSSVKMNLKALREKVGTDPTYAELGDIAVAQTDRLEHMLSSLLQYGKPLELDREAVSFTTLAKEVETAVAPLLEAEGVALCIRDKTGETSLWADREQMRRALTNLVDNAVRASSPGGTVVLASTVSEAVRGRALEIAVTDEGPGLPPEIRERLFDPFVTTRGEGTGLGLANVRKIVELHGGTVAAETLPGGGAKFTMTLPVGGSDR